MRRLPPWTKPDQNLFVGMQLVELTPELRLHYGAREDRGVLVLRVESNSPAAQAGVLVGDVLTEIDLQPVIAPAGLWSSLALWSPDLPLPLGLIRNSEPLIAEIQLLKPTSEGSAASSRQAPPRAGSEALEREIERLERRLEALRRRVKKPQE
jgi:serine protease Do